MSEPNGARPELPSLPLEEWEPARDTLHLWVQIVGKVRMASSAPRNHWWHAPLYVDVHGLTTRRLHSRAGATFQIDLDLLDQRLVVRTGAGDEESFALEDGVSVADFDERLHAALRRLEVDVAIREVPYGVPWTTPFPEDRAHAAYDPDATRRFWRILDWSDSVFDEFAGWFWGKTSPVHFFWHSFDLAVTRFDGRRAPEIPGADPVTREAYSHEVVSFGFWAGDRSVREPSYYAYAAPEPADLRDQPLRPGDARWMEQRGGSLAILPYESIRCSGDPRGTLLAFLQSAYQAGALALGWSRDDLISTWCPGPPELQALLEGAGR